MGSLNDTQSMIGHLIRTPMAKRDAIHVAVTPAVAGVSMQPNDRVRISGWCEDIPSVEPAEPPTGPEAVGVIDPFLRQTVYKGDVVWVFLFPNSVTGMRHHWTHPLFDRTPSPAKPPEADVEASWRWIREFADKHGGELYDYTQGGMVDWSAEALVNEASSAVGDHNDGDGWMSFGSCEHLRDAFYGADGILFWKHWQVVTGRTLPEDFEPGYSCGC